jgi:superfamily II DNA or RNA helicase
MSSNREPVVSSSFKNLKLDLSYDSGSTNSNVVKNFYSPVLELSKRYDRVAGYFSSASLAVAGRGISGLVKNGGKMRLITSHALQKSDIGVLQNFYESEQWAREFIEEFEKSYAIFGELNGTVAKNHVAAMCWLLKYNYLEIKLVVPSSSFTKELSTEEIEKFHPKFGIFEDIQGDKIAFVGSINETAMAWRQNIESFEVFQDWDSENDAKRTRRREEKFSQYWNNQLGSDWKTIDLSLAIKSQLILKFAPDDFPPDIDLDEQEVFEKRPLRDYQRGALTNWIDSSRVGLFEMATGTGKTRTARACIESCLNLGRLLTLVIVPYNHIAEQWRNELKAHDPYLINSSWRRDIPQMALEVQQGFREHVTLIAVQNTASSKDFRLLIQGIRSHFVNFLIVGDEVHWLGASNYQSAMMSEANFRLGLSATPIRYFDEEGTMKVKSYFGYPPVFKLDLRDALKIRDESGNRILCDYKYHPVFVNLDEEELQEYREITRVISAIRNSDDIDDREDKIRDKLIERADILKLAKSKIPALREVLNKIDKPIRHLLVYCADNSQLELALPILNEFGLSVQKITGEEGTRTSSIYNDKNERQHLIDSFAEGKLDVLLAIRCLDEGVDIPAARTSIILASSGNVKEFIQRRGRVMRVFPDKDFANIFDMCVLPEDPAERIPAIVEREKARVLQYAEDALNVEEVKIVLSQIEGDMSNDG